MAESGTMQEALRGPVATEEGRAQVALLTQRYWGTGSGPDAPFTGRYFESFCDRNEPNRVTTGDLVAVSMLGINVPADVAIWLLGDGAEHLEQLLVQVPAEADFWAHGELLERGQPMWDLWGLLNQGRWPTPTPGNGMGRTTISKLLAAKRPALVPIWDSVVEGVLGPADEYWSSLRAAWSPELVDLWTDATRDAPEHVTLLRRVDAALWMYGRSSRTVAPV